MRPEVAAFLARIAELNLQPVPADPDRATADYPRMPAGTCYLSSRALAVSAFCVISNQEP